MEIAIFSLILVFVALLFIKVGFKLVEADTLNLLMFQLGKVVKNAIQGFWLAPTSYLLGVMSYESGLFAYFNKAVAYREPLPLSSASQMLFWNRLGQIAFVWIIFQPLWVFICFILSILIALLLIEKKVFPFMIAVLLGIFFIKYGAYMLEFAGDYFAKYGSHDILANIQEWVHANTWAIFVIPFLITLLFNSLTPAFITVVIALNFLGLSAQQGLLALSAIFSALCCYSLFVGKELKGAMQKILQIRTVQEGTLAILFFVLSLMASSFFPPLKLPGDFIAAVAGVVLIVGLVNLCIPQRLHEEEEGGPGLSLFPRYAFASSFAGIKLFIYQLTKGAAAVTSYTTLQEGALRQELVEVDANHLHSELGYRLRELNTYLKTLKKQRDETSAAAQVPIMQEMLHHLEVIEGNLYTKTLIMNRSRAPEELLDTLDSFIQAEDAVLSTYFSLMENPDQEEIETMHQITHALLGRLGEMEDSSVASEIVKKLLELYKSDIAAIESLANLLEKWVNFLPRYDLRHARLQQA